MNHKSCLFAIVLTVSLSLLWAQPAYALPVIPEYHWGFCVPPGEVVAFNLDDILADLAGPLPPGGLNWSRCDPFPPPPQLIVDLVGADVTIDTDAYTDCYAEFKFCAYSAVNGALPAVLDPVYILWVHADVIPSFLEDIPDPDPLGCGEEVLFNLDDYVVENFHVPYNGDPPELEWTAEVISGPADAVQIEIDQDNVATVRHVSDQDATVVVRFEACLPVDVCIPPPGFCTDCYCPCYHKDVTITFDCPEPTPAPQPVPCLDCPANDQMLAAGWFCPGVGVTVMGLLMVGIFATAGRTRRW